jgi:hypothetical protein
VERPYERYRPTRLILKVARSSHNMALDTGRSASGSRRSCTEKLYLEQISSVQNHLEPIYRSPAGPDAPSPNLAVGQDGGFLLQRHQMMGSPRIPTSPSPPVLNTTACHTQRTLKMLPPIPRACHIMTTPTLRLMSSTRKLRAI